MRPLQNQYLELLSAQEVESIHETTLALLEEVGVKVLEEKSLDLLAEAGAKVDSKSKIAKFPPNMVEKWIKKAPSTFTIYARDETKNMVFEDGNTHYVSMQTTPFVFDVDSGDRRLATFKDCCNMSKMADYLEHDADGYCMVHPEDVLESAAHAYMVKAQIENSSKVFRGRVNGQLVAEDSIKIALMMAGGEAELKKKPNTYTLVSITSPLVMDTDQLKGMIQYAEKGLPCILATAVMAGATGPVTLAGTIVQANAEILSHMVLAQIINPGTPVIYGSASSVMDMKTSCMRYGAIEQGMIGAAIAQLARFYKVPSRIVAGATDSKVLDMQAGTESTRNLMLASLAGGSTVSCALGGMEMGLTTSFEKVILDHENILNIKRMLGGIDVNKEELSKDVIKEVGPGGQFLSHMQTMKNFRTAHFLPDYVDTKSYDTWVSDKDAVNNKVKAKVHEIIDTHETSPVDKKLSAEIDVLIESIEKRAA